MGMKVKLLESPYLTFVDDDVELLEDLLEIYQLRDVEFLITTYS